MGNPALKLDSPTEKYILGRLLGRGAAGTVHRATDTDSGREVALKKLIRYEASNLLRFKEEFRQLAGLHHPNLVSLYELVGDGDTWFFTMELIEGCSFYDYVRGTQLAANDITITADDLGNGGCDYQRLREVIPQLIAGISALHQAGKLHLDIKPSNVLVTPAGRLAMLDFGLVRPASESAQSSHERRAVAGTPVYMSPEQAMGEALGPASDWFSAGIMLWEAVVGHLPTEGDMREVMTRRISERIPPLAEVVPDVPDDIDRLVDGLVQHNPALRKVHGFRGPRTSIRHSLRPDAQARRPSQDPQDRLFGRSRGLGLLREARSRAREGKPSSLLVHGISGMGKTALLRAFLAETRADEDTVVLSGNCYERESVPYKAFDNVIDALTAYLLTLEDQHAATLLPRDIRALARLFPVLERVPTIAYSHGRSADDVEPLVVRKRGFAALKELFARIRDERLLVVHVDDLQWGDADTARLILDLLGPPDPPPILFVGTYRSDEVDSSPFLQEVLRSDVVATGMLGLQTVELAPLPQEEAEGMASTLLGSLAVRQPGLAKRIATEAEGIPFFVTELVRYQRQQTDSEESTEQITLEHALKQRTERLTDPAKDLLRTLSVATRPLEQGPAAQAAGLSGGEREVFAALRAAKLIRTHGTRQTDTAEPYHARIRDVVIHGLNQLELQQQHRQLAQALEGWGIDDPERLFAHYDGCGERHRASRCAIRAADRAAEQLAFNRAGELYERALELEGGDAASHTQLTRKLAEALANAGRGARAAEHYLAVAPHCDPRSRRDLERRAAAQLVRSGRAREGIALAKKVLREVGIPYPENAWAAKGALLWNRLRLKLGGMDFEARGDRAVPDQLLDQIQACGSISREVAFYDPLQGSLLQSIFLRLALKSGDPQLALKALASRAQGTAVLMGTRSEHEVGELLARMRELSESIGTPEARATLLMTEAGCALYMGRFGDVAKPSIEAEHLFSEQCTTGTFWEKNIAAINRYAATQFSDISTISKEALSIVRDAEERDDRFTIGNVVFIACTHHLAMDNPEAALEMLEQTRMRLDQNQFGTTHVAFMLRSIDTHLYRDEPQLARLAADEARASFEQSFIAKSQFLRIAAQFAWARCMLATMNEGPETLPLARQLADRLQDEETVLSRNLATLVRAGIALHAGDQEACVGHLERAAKGLDEVHAPIYAACARYQLGRLTEANGGAETMHQSREFLHSRGITRPDRWAAVYTPLSQPTAPNSTSPD